MNTLPNYQVMNTPGRPVKAWINGVPIEDAARTQLANIASLPFIHKWVAAMPDVHLGKGATVGSVIATHKAIVPAAVGVDIGCGMIASRTSLTANDLPDSLREVRARIEKAVPHGFTDRGGKNDRGAWHSLPARVAAAWAELAPGYAELPQRAAWAGLRGFVPDRRFVVGADPHWPRLVWATALGGHGLTSCLAVGELAAGAVFGEATPAALDPARYPAVEARS